MKKILPIIFCFFLLSSITKASVTYSISSLPYAPLSYSSGTILPTGLADDIYSSVLPLGFTFNFFGNDYADIVIGSNGIVSFDTTHAGGFCAWVISATIPDTRAVDMDMKNAIMCPFHDINPAASSTNHIAYFTFGTAPNRRFVVNFYNVPLFSCSSTINTGQVILYEGSNNIDINLQDKPVCAGWGGGDATEGIQDALGTDAYVIPGRNKAVWTASNESYRFCYNGVCPVVNDSTEVVIRGKAYYDWNSNCAFDSISDIAAPYQYIVNDSGYVLAMTDINGNYELYSDTGSRVISIDNSSYFQTACPTPSNYPLHITVAPDTISHLDFGDTAFHCIAPELGIYSWGLRDCDTVTLSNISITYNNPSPVMQYNSSLILHLNDSMHINAAFSYVYSYLGGNDYLIDIPDTMPSMSFENIIVPINTGCDSLGTLYSYSAELISENTCGIHIDTAVNITALSSAIDPNNKLVRRFGQVGYSFEEVSEIDSLSTLEYVINFQNEGTAIASFVKIRDIISSKLILGSIRIVSSSFPCYLSISGNEVTFNFDNINLPFGTIDDPTTHGYVIFRIAQAMGHRRGTEIENVASIYFDNATAVVTNIALAKIPYACNGLLNPVLTPVTCHNDEDGVISINPTSLYAAPRYLWSNGENMASINHLSAGTYSVTVYDSLGCTYINSYTLSNPSEVNVSISSTKDTACKNELISLTASGTEAYTWEGFSVSSPYLNNILAATTTFTVVGYDAKSCSDTASITIYMKDCNVGIETISANLISIFPSPSKDWVTIQVEQNDINAIKIYSFEGRLIKNYEFENASNSRQIQIGDLSSGVYLIKAMSTAHSYIGKVVKE